MRLKSFALFTAVLALGIGTRSAQAQITFNLIPATGMDTNAIAGFQKAADRWTSLLTSSAPVTFNININFANLGAGILGSTQTQSISANYSAVRNALVNNATSADDLASVVSLPAVSALSVNMNYTSDNPNGAGSLTPYTTTNAGISGGNTVLGVARTNAKVLGLIAGNNTAQDASISFTNNLAAIQAGLAWNFNGNGSVASNEIDFVGVAQHEIGHALGFTSGVDVLDTNNGTFSASAYQKVYGPLDLFRYSGAGVRDWTADTRRKYFSVDGGVTAIADFAQGTVHGSTVSGQKWQASHWQFQNVPKIGIMDPAVSNGYAPFATGNDLRAFDVIGYSLVPAPPAALVFVAGSVLIGWRMRRRPRAS